MVSHTCFKFCGNSFVEMEGRKMNLIVKLKNDEFVKYDEEKFERINYFIDENRGILEVTQVVSEDKNSLVYVDSYNWNEVMYVSFWEED